MISLDEARQLVLSAMGPLPDESVALEKAAGRILAADVSSPITQPPFAASAMDGYAVRFSDLAATMRFAVIGESSAGLRHEGDVKSGQAVRIFTGAPVPQGADHVVIQEDTEKDGDDMRIVSPQKEPANIREAGIDFIAGQIILSAGTLLTGPHLALAAAAGLKELRVRRTPRVALIANGNELVLPGELLSQDQIVCSIPYGLVPMIEAWGGKADFLGIASDDEEDIRRLIGKGRNYDLIVPIGGASVGDKDLMHAAFGAEGYESIFRKIAVKPGKPTWFGKLGPSYILGLPGNPAAALTMGLLLIELAIAAMLGRAKASALPMLKAKLTAGVERNGARETYLRAKLSRNEDGTLNVMPSTNQDSSLLSVFATADALIQRIVRAEALAAGEEVSVLPLNHRSALG